MNANQDDSAVEGFLTLGKESFRCRGIARRLVGEADWDLAAYFPHPVVDILPVWDRVPTHLADQVLRDIVTRMEHSQQHPLQCTESFAASIGETVVHAAMGEANSYRQYDQWLRLDQQVPARHLDSGISGVSDFVMYRNEVPVCVIELKSRARGPQQLEHATTQGAIAAAIHSRDNDFCDVAVIASNLEEWRFVRYGNNRHEHYPTVYVGFEDGLRGELHDLLGWLVSFFRAL